MGLCRFREQFFTLNTRNWKKIKPGVPRKVHLLAAALLWTVVGILLLVRGLGWIHPAENGWFLAAALVLGTLKSRFILDRSARRSIKRIVRLQDGTCLGAVYSWKTWLLVAVMMASGIVLRVYFDPGRYIGMIYCAVGWALFLSSRLGWVEWFRWHNDRD